jgi:hypothetical protein
MRKRLRCLEHWPHCHPPLFSGDSIVFLETSSSNLDAPTDIFSAYEVASGQKVNLQKSSIFFDKGSRDDDKIVLKQVIGLTQKSLVRDISDYRLLLVDQRRALLSIVRECSRGKISDWKGQGLSKAVKEVLVKSVLQATPTYSMSYFQLPKKMCRNLTSISSNF